MITAFELFIVGVVLFAVLGVILYTSEPEPHNKFDEHYAMHDMHPPHLSRLDSASANGNAPENFIPSGFH